MAIKEIKMPGKYGTVFDRDAKPVAHIDSGETVILYTEDAMEGKNNDNSKESVMGYNPLTGPLYVNGAEPGDSLKVTINSIIPIRDWGVSCFMDGFGALVPTGATRMMRGNIPRTVFVYKFNEDFTEIRHNDLLRFPYEPFLGTIGTVLADEILLSWIPFCNGGNMDVPDTKPGNIVYLPVSVPGALLSLGDVHARQGHGELCGVAIEVAAKVSITVELEKGKTIKQPRIESPTELMCVGSCKPMDDAARMAYHELIGWMVELGWDKLAAYQALTQCGKMYVGNMVDPVYSLVAKVDKEIAYRAQKNKNGGK